MKIAVDAMGGDFAPQVIVEGTVLAAKEYGIKVVLVGDEDQVSKELSRYPTSKLPIYIHHAPFVVAMHDSPSTVIRRMKDTSIKVALDLAKEGQVSGVVSAGNSGAAMGLAMYILKKLEGVERPAIATIHPATKGSTVLIDSGGTVDFKTFHLVQFAMMGDAYAKYILRKEEPRIGVLSNGEEEGKGNELTREVHDILSENRFELYRLCGGPGSQQWRSGCDCMRWFCRKCGAQSKRRAVGDHSCDPQAGSRG